MTAQSKSLRGSRSSNRSTQAKTSRKTMTRDANRASQSGSKSRSVLLRYLPGWVLLGAALLIVLPQVLSLTFGTAGYVITSIPNWLTNLSLVSSGTTIAPLFTREVDYWSADIQRWATQYNVDPNLLATVMQIESCGHDTVSSVAGAQGLFQVMPFHFDSGENMLDPNTNAMRGARFLNECLGYANGDPGLAMACYNGGPSVVRRPFSQWAAETQRYYTWGTAIYLDAIQNNRSSATLQNWLDAGGSNLCTRSAQRLGL
jgi:soluble lytic murein transglycosylase-like protein